MTALSTEKLEQRRLIAVAMSDWDTVDLLDTIDADRRRIEAVTIAMDRWEQWGDTWGWMPQITTTLRAALAPEEVQPSE